MKEQLDPREFMITRKRKKYKFAMYHNNPLCFELDEWRGQPIPQVMEVGAGTGLFSVELARVNPDKRFLAVDVKADRLQTGAKRAVELGLDNIQFLRARVDQLKDVIQPSSLNTVWVTFPDPFPKERYAKHRLTHPAFLSIYESLLAMDGILRFKTDAKALFDWSLERIVENKWIIIDLSFDLHHSSLLREAKIETTYERRYLGEGKPINYVAAIRPR